jgi:hypothetical protein
MATTDLAGQKVGLCLRDVKGQCNMIRKTLGLANEKERSISALCSGLADGCDEASQGQLAAAQSTLLGFAAVIRRAENPRQVLCDRLAPLSTSFLARAFDTMDLVLEPLQKREKVVRKAQRLPVVDKDGQADKHNQVRDQAAAVNRDAIREARAWYGTYSTELRKVFKEYATAQMEFAARALEQWSQFLEDLPLVDFSDDTDQIVTMLEGDSV